MARVASPHIVRVMALRETEHGLFIVMEYVDGGSLHDRMADGPMPWATLWPLLRQMLLGLEAAHTVGVVHRDIKPRNVLLTTDDTVKLTDFGLARLQSDGDATRTQAVAGTLAYMSPEQVRSLPTLDHRSDLFSLGLTAYEALVGRLPFDRDGGDFTMMRAIVEDEFPAPTAFDDRVPPEVATALMRALEKDPDRRYASAAEMREALAGVGDDAAPDAAPAATGRPAPEAGPRHGPDLARLGPSPVARHPRWDRGRRAGAAGPRLVADADLHAHPRPARRGHLLPRWGAGRRRGRREPRHARGPVRGPRRLGDDRCGGGSRRRAAGRLRDARPGRRRVGVLGRHGRARLGARGRHPGGAPADAAVARDGPPHAPRHLDAPRHDAHRRCVAHVRSRAPPAADRRGAGRNGAAAAHRHSRRPVWPHRAADAAADAIAASATGPAAAPFPAEHRPRARAHGDRRCDDGRRGDAFPRRFQYVRGEPGDESRHLHRPLSGRPAL